MTNFFDNPVHTKILLDNLASAVFVIDSKGTIVFWNRSAGEMLGYSSEEIVGKENISILHDEDTIDDLRQEISHAFGIGGLSDVRLLFAVAERSVRQRRVWKYRKKNGHLLVVEISLSLLPNSSSQSGDLLVTARDIEERQGLTELKTTLLSRLSHEMRTPLHGIIGALELLTPTVLSLDQRELITLARSKSDILLTLINDIFEYSLSQGRSLSLERVVTEPRTVMSNIVEVLNERIASRDLRLSATIDEMVPQLVLSDPVRLYQVLLSVVSVMANFMNNGTIHIALEYLFSTNDEFGGLYFTIRGAAETINAQKRAHIISLMQHDEDTADISTESLQVAVTRSVIMAMGGFFWSEKKEYTSEHETTLYIVLSVENADTVSTNASTFATPFDVPFDIAAASSNQAISSPRRDDTAIPSLRGQAEYQKKLPGILGTQSPQYSAPPKKMRENPSDKRILIVDDDPDNCSLAALFLKDLKSAQGNALVIEIANNGMEALAAAQKHRFDVILMDIQMPVLDGFEATEAIRAFERNNRFRRTPILAVTAHTMANYRELCLQKGLDDYMSKPVKKQQLQDFVQKWLDHKPLVLIADDSEDYRLLLKLQFDKKKQYSIIFASTGQEAIDLCQNHDVSAILLDMQMPIMTGYEAAPILRQMPKYSTLPIWGLTAHEDTAEIKKVLAAGCDKCFTKGTLAVIRQIIVELDSHFAVESIVPSEKV